MAKGHIALTVGGTKTQLPIDPNTWSEVDIVDFAPRAVAGTPAWSEQGIYLDVGQDKWNHGFGQWDYAQPANYAYSGHLVDTRHKGITLLTTFVETVNTASTGTFLAFLVHRNIRLFIIESGPYNKSLGIFRPSNGNLYAVAATTGFRKLLDTGPCVLGSNTGRMQVIDVFTASSSTNNTVTLTNAGWDTNAFATGTAYIVDGTGLTAAKTVSSNTSNTLTISGTWTVNPDTTSVILVVANTGLTANPPNNFDHLMVFGGYFWGAENGTRYLHYWSGAFALTAEGGQTADANAIVVGPDGGKIVNMIAFNNQLWVFREEGAWVIGEDNLAYHTLDFSSERSSLNFQTLLVWQGFLIFSVRNALYKYKAGLQDITPPVWSEDPPYKQFGNFRGLVARGKFLYVLAQSNAANTSDESSEYNGFVALLVHDGVGWHKLTALGNTNGLASDSFNLWLDPLNDRLYMFIRFLSSPDQTILFYIQLQTLSDLPYANYPTTGSHYLYTSYYDMGMVRIPKSWGSITIAGEFPTGTSAIVQFRVDDTKSWTTLGTFNTDLQEISFPAGTEGKKIQFRINLQTTSSTQTPIVKALIMKMMLRPDVLYGVRCQVLVEGNLHDQNMIGYGHTAEVIRAALKSARSSVSPITLEDVHGESASAYLASLRFRLVEYEDKDYWAEIADCTFVYV